MVINTGLPSCCNQLFDKTNKDIVLWFFFIFFFNLESHCKRVALSFSIDDTEETEVSFRKFTLDQAPSYVRNGGWFISRDWSVCFRGGTTSMEISTHPSCGKFTKSYRAEFFLQRRTIPDFWFFQDFLSLFGIYILKTFLRLFRFAFHSTS